MVDLRVIANQTVIDRSYVPDQIAICVRDGPLVGTIRSADDDSIACPML
jgi:hypothetical protein